MAAVKYFDQLYRQNPNYFSHIEGLRAIAGLWMILYHIAVFSTLYLTQPEIHKLLDHPFFKITLSCSVTLDVFFVISGLVIGYTLIKEINNTGTVDVYRFLTRRCARVYPVYLFIILFCGLFSASTFHNAWYNILQLNNLIPVQQQHIPWAWSLALDFQFYVLFSIIIWLISKKILGKRACYTLIIGFFLLPIVSTILLIMIDPPFPFSSNLYSLRSKEAHHYFNMGFMQLPMRCSPFLYGLLTAYILVHHKNTLQRILQRLHNIHINLLAIALLTMIFILLANDPIWFINDTNAWQTSAHWSLMTQRNIFSLLLCILLLLAESPKGIVMTLFFKILNSAIWRPFGQLTFTSYLIHPIVIRIGNIFFFALHNKTTAVEYWKYALWLVPLIYLISIPLYLFIEQPAMHYLKQKLGTNRRPVTSLAGQSFAE